MLRIGVALQRGDASNCISPTMQLSSPATQWLWPWHGLVVGRRWSAVRPPTTHTFTTSNGSRSLYHVEKWARRNFQPLPRTRTSAKVVKQSALGFQPLRKSREAFLQPPLAAAVPAATAAVVDVTEEEEKKPSRGRGRRLAARTERRRRPTSTCAASLPSCGRWAWSVPAHHVPIVARCK